MSGVNEAVSAAWESVVEKWDDAARHEALLALVVQHSAFAWAAARYKEKGDDPIAVERLDRLRKAATATMMATASSRKGEEERSPYTKTMVWLVVMTIMLIIGLLFARIVTDRAPKHPPHGQPLRAPTGARH